MAVRAEIRQTSSRQQQCQLAAGERLTASAGAVAMAGPSSRIAAIAASLQRAAKSLPL